jgi:hypothetical protein
MPIKHSSQKVTESDVRQRRECQINIVHKKCKAREGTPNKHSTDVIFTVKLGGFILPSQLHGHSDKP